MEGYKDKYLEEVKKNEKLHKDIVLADRLNSILYNLLKDLVKEVSQTS